MTASFDAYKRAEKLVSERQYRAAVKVLEPLLETDPDTASVQLLAGRAYYGAAALPRAEQAFRRVIDLDPADHYARFVLARTLQRQSKVTEALAQFRIAVAMHPSPEYREGLNELLAYRAARGA